MNYSIYIDQKFADLGKSRTFVKSSGSDDRNLRLL